VPKQGLFSRAITLKQLYFNRVPYARLCGLCEHKTVLGSRHALEDKANLASPAMAPSRARAAAQNTDLTKFFLGTPGSFLYSRYQNIKPLLLYIYNLVTWRLEYEKLKTWRLGDSYFLKWRPGTLAAGEFQAVSTASGWR
jgi:hypothetical protein